MKKMVLSTVTSFWSPLILLLHVLSGSLESCSGEISRNDFPPDFIFGAGSSAYQVEGAAYEDGKTPSLWDTFTHAGKMADKSNGDIATDQYHKYKEDVKLMVDTNLDAYRFSISWSRLIQNGNGAFNRKGVEYYNNLINELISHGIEPHATLFHYDLPQSLEDEYGGWLSRKIVKDFTAYADVCFREFGDRVSTWTTINEANIFILGTYQMGLYPPQRCSSPFGSVNCTSGNSTTEPYIVAHNCLLAHASAARLYKRKYKAKQHGSIGINLMTNGFSPLTNSTEDIAATQRATDFYVGWFADPLFFGDYPMSMKRNVGSRLPSFTPYEAKLVRGSCDFFGLNHYLTYSIKDNPESLKIQQRDFTLDMAAQRISDWSSQGKGIVLPDVYPTEPSSLQRVLEYFKQVYGNPPIYIHENGQKTFRAARDKSINDTVRVNFLKGYIGGLLDALRNGSNTKGYFAWSLLDSIEFLDGYASNFGLYYIDLINDPDLNRYPKLSAHWYTDFLKRGSKRSNTISLTADENIHFSQ